MEYTEYCFDEKFSITISFFQNNGCCLLNGLLFPYDYHIFNSLETLLFNLANYLTENKKLFKILFPLSVDIIMKVIIKVIEAALSQEKINEMQLILLIKNCLEVQRYFLFSLKQKIFQNKQYINNFCFISFTLHFLSKEYTTLFSSQNASEE